ncbi:MAG TPA: FGGY family carbohydrate kinase [Solirubrobacteraceae bacterium]
MPGLRSVRAHRLGRPEGASPRLPAAGLGRARPGGGLRNVEEVIARALSDARLEPTDLVALGIANQRETTIVWDRQTGQAVHPAINWQDMRTDHIVRALAAGVLLLGTQAALAARHGSGAQRPRAGRRGAVRDEGLMADLASDRGGV